MGTHAGIVGENASETLRQFELPKLPEDASALQFGDWLSMVDSQMGDLSYTSEFWWGLVRNAADRSYRDWLGSGPLERLRIKPQLDPRAQGWPRTERRALAMLLAAVPDHIRNEAISSRRMSTDQLVFRLCVVYQPGGPSERTKLLHSITDAKCGTGNNDILEWLRMWRRNVQRAMELNVTLPDGLVLLGTLAKCADALSQKSPQIAYRLNMVRQQLNLDQQPFVASILSFTEHLQAEAEDLALSHPSKGPAGVVKTAALTVPPGIEPPGLHVEKEKKKGSCKFWMSETGCKFGDKCKWFHATLDPKSNRCFNCSGLGHSRQDCPLKSGNVGNTKKAAKVKTPDRNPSGTGNGKGSSGTKDATEEPTAKVAAMTALPEPPGLTSTTPAPASGSAERNGGETVQELLSEATALLKSMKTANPKIKALVLKKLGDGLSRTGLLDGGATHPLRRGTPEELAVAEPITVEVAMGSVQLKQHPVTNCILTSTPVEPIVPLRGLIELGYHVKWSSSGFEIKHPVRGLIKSQLRGGCPIVDEQHALYLIGEIEALERSKKGLFGLDECTPDEVNTWWSSKFPEVPQRIWKFMSSQNQQYSTERLP